MLARRGEHQLVVVAAREHAALFQLGVVQRRESPRSAGCGRTARCAPTPERSRMCAKIAGEAVGNVDRRVREAAQALAELDARLGLVQALRRRRRSPDARGRARRRRARPKPRCRRPAARRRAPAPAPAAPRRCGDADACAARRAWCRRRRGRRRSARRARTSPAENAVQPGLVGRGQRERERRPARRGAHRRHVGEVHRQRLVAERARLGAGAGNAALRPACRWTPRAPCPASGRSSAQSSPTPSNARLRRAG